MRLRAVFAFGCVFAFLGCGGSTAESDATPGPVPCGAVKCGGDAYCITPNDCPGTDSGRGGPPCGDLTPYCAPSAQIGEACQGGGSILAIDTTHHQAQCGAM